MEIAVPVPGTDERPAGVLKVVADIREMLVSVAGMDLGSNGDAMLLRRNGSIVFSRDAVQPSARFFGADRLKERLDEASTVTGPSRLFFTAVEPHAGSQIVGVATSQLSSTYPHLPWVVAAWQSEADLLVPVASEYRSLLLLFAIAGVIVLALALWFTVKLSAPMVETEMALVAHPRLHRVAEEETV
jgi:hypothetical protein